MAQIDERRLSIREDASSRVLVIYTGGTIGMKKDQKLGYVVQPHYFASALKELPMFYDKTYVKEFQSVGLSHTPAYLGFPELVMPLSKLGKRIFYYIKEEETIMDSSNMSMTDWLSIARSVKLYYKDFDAFIILHGTDTLAYTASALSFMLENLGKTVILTGAQIPIFELRNDARSNLIGSLIIAGHYIIPETWPHDPIFHPTCVGWPMLDRLATLLEKVAIYFSNKLLRGCRCVKLSTSDLDAFTSPNLPPLLTMGINIEVKWDSIFRSKSSSENEFKICDRMDKNVGVLRLFPSIPAEIVNSFLKHPMQGVVIETFGAGNVPSNRPDLMNEFKMASERGVILVNITQCLKGSVSDAYAAGKAFLELGVLPGYDMTTEAALAKLSYVLALDHVSLNQKREMMLTNLRGEMTIDKEQQFRLKEGKFVRTVATALKVGSEKEMDNLRRALLPMFLCCAAKSGDISALDELLAQGADVNNPSDYDGKSCLHIACAEGNVDMVKHLISIGASVYVKDRRGRVPLFDAIRNGNKDAMKVLLRSGAHFLPNDSEVLRELCIAASRNDTESLKLWKAANVDLNMSDVDGRTPLHFAVMRGKIDVVRYLVKDIGIHATKEDIFGNTPLSNARKLRSQEIIDILVESDGILAREIGTVVECRGEDLADIDISSSNYNGNFSNYFN